MNLFSNFFYGNDNNKIFEEVYEVGKPFPRKRNKAGDGNVFTYIFGLGPCIISYYTNPTNDEIAARQHGAIEIGLLCHKDAIYVLGKYGRDYSEGPFNIHLEPKEMVNRILKDKSGYLQVFLVDAATNILKVARTLQMTPCFAKYLREGIKQQYESSFSMDEYNATCNEIMSSFELPELFQLAPVKFFVRSTEEEAAIKRLEAEQTKNPVELRDGLVHIFITKEDVDEHKVEELADWFYNLMSSKNIRAVRQRVVVEFCGYGTDAREVYEIPEVRTFIKELDKKFPYWFYILNLQHIGLKNIFHCICDAEKVGTNSIKLDNSLVPSFFELHLGALYYLAEKTGMSEAETETCDELIKNYFRDILKLDENTDEFEKHAASTDENAYSGDDDIDEFEKLIVSASEDEYNEEDDDDEDYDTAEDDYDEDEDDLDEDENGDAIATDEELKAEAILRLRYCDKMEPFILHKFIEEGEVYMSEREGILYSLEDHEKELLQEAEAKMDCLVYHVLHYVTQDGEIYAFLYVHRHKLDWHQERESMQESGRCWCYAYNIDNPRYSESGSIGIMQINGGLMRNTGMFGRPL